MPSAVTPSAQSSESSARVSRPWVIAFVAMTCFIWGNSLVPGGESGALSAMVVQLLRDALAVLGLPGDWVTNFLVRKTAHFSEYLALALIAMQAFAPHRAPVRAPRVVLTVLLLVAVPCVDETIQLFTPGRAGLPTDVLIDCAGAATGTTLTALTSRLRRVGRSR